MLFTLDFERTGTEALEPVEFKSMTDLNKLELDLERVLADNLFDVLFEEAQWFPIFRQRPRQKEADIYALDRQGNLVIFELKRETAGAGAVAQLIQYAQDAGSWTYKKLNRLYRTFMGNDELELRDDHCEAFFLDEPLATDRFNSHQLLRVVGHAADDELVRIADYWKRQGLDLDFLPYRIYELGGRLYLEFFSPPYDRHRNPAHKKGVLFDTNASWDQNSVWEMMENSRVAAYGDAKRFVRHVYPGDIVFFYHRGRGVIAAREVASQVREAGPEHLYRDVRFLTPIPTRNDGISKAVSAASVSQATGRSFFWARTIKVPYLSLEESQGLLEELRRILATEDRL